jgi:hypothetical protein
MKIHQLILLFALVSFYLLLASGSNAFSSLPPPPVQPPPVVDTSPDGTTALPNTPWALCQSIPQSCIIGGVVGGTNVVPPLSSGSQPCPIGSNIISNQCMPIASPGMTMMNTRPSLSGAPSSNGCLPGELAEDNLCIRAQSTLSSPQPQQQQQQLQEPQQQLPSACPQGTIFENNLCFPQQQVQTANFTPPNQQLTQQQVQTANFSSQNQQGVVPQVSSDHKSKVVSNMESFSRNDNGISIGSNGTSCNMANQSSSGCNANGSVYQSAIGKVSTIRSKDGLVNGTGLPLPSHPAWKKGR